MNRQKESEKNISELEDKIKKNKGQVIFCSRELKVPGKFIGGFRGSEPPDHYHYYESGIVKGEAEIVDKAPSNMITLRKSFGDLEYPRDIMYNYPENITIPVDRRLSGFIRLYFPKLFQFDIKSLEELSSGRLSIGFKELGKYLAVEEVLEMFGRSNRERTPELQKFGLFIGDEEVRKFLSEKNIKNYTELFEILKNPDAVKRRVDNHYDEKRKELAKDVVLLVHEIDSLHNQITGIEEKVMKAYLVREAEQDGSYTKWLSNSGETDVVDNYTSLRYKLENLISELRETFEKGETINLNQLQEVRGESIGFPVGISTKKYLEWVNNYVLSKVEERVLKIDAHLSEENKKVRSS